MNVNSFQIINLGQVNKLKKDLILEDAVINGKSVNKRFQFISILSVHIRVKVR